MAENSQSYTNWRKSQRTDAKILTHECGIFGAIFNESTADSEAAQLILVGTEALQHR